VGVIAVTEHRLRKSRTIFSRRPPVADFRLIFKVLSKKQL